MAWLQTEVQLSICIYCCNITDLLFLKKHWRQMEKNVLIQVFNLLMYFSSVGRTEKHLVSSVLTWLLWKIMSFWNLFFFFFFISPIGSVGGKKDIVAGNANSAIPEKQVGLTSFGLSTLTFEVVSFSKNFFHVFSFLCHCL